MLSFFKFWNKPEPKKPEPKKPKTFSIWVDDDSLKRVENMMKYAGINDCYGLAHQMAYILDQYRKLDEQARRLPVPDEPPDPTAHKGFKKI